MVDDKTLFSNGYRLFLAVAECGSIRAAARHLNLAPSAVSRHVAKLEDALGVALLERYGNSTRLTEAGDLLQASLLQSSSGHEQTLQQIDALRGLRRGKLRLATVESVAVELLPRILKDFMRDHPAIEISSIVSDARRVTSMLLAHEADVGFTFNPETSAGLGIAYQRAMPVGAVMVPNHPLATSRALTLAHCLRHPVAWPALGLSLRTVLDAGLKKADAVVKPVFESNSLRLMTALAMTGRCLAFQTEIGIARELQSGSLVFRPLRKDGLPEDRLVVLERPGLTGHPAVKTFMTLAKQHLPR